MTLGTFFVHASEDEGRKKENKNQMIKSAASFVRKPSGDRMKGKVKCSLESTELWKSRSLELVDLPLP